MKSGKRTCDFNDDDQFGENNDAKRLKISDEGDENDDNLEEVKEDSNSHSQTCDIGNDVVENSCKDKDINHNNLSDNHGDEEQSDLLSDDVLKEGNSDYKIGVESTHEELRDFNKVGHESDDPTNVFGQMENETDYLTNTFDHIYQDIMGDKNDKESVSYDEIPNNDEIDLNSKDINHDFIRYSQAITQNRESCSLDGHEYEADCESEYESHEKLGVIEPTRMGYSKVIPYGLYIYDVEYDEMKADTSTDGTVTVTLTNSNGTNIMTEIIEKMPTDPTEDWHLTQDRMMNAHYFMNKFDGRKKRSNNNILIAILLYGSFFSGYSVEANVIDKIVTIKLFGCDDPNFNVRTFRRTIKR